MSSFPEDSLEASLEPSRIDSNNGHSSAIFGQVYWSPTKSVWITFVYIGAMLGGAQTFHWDALLLCIITSFVTLSAGYSVGIHRRLIHNSFRCHQWLENILVYLGVLIGIGGPFSIIEKHDLRDWAQRQPNAHPYFTSRRNILVDWIWTLHCSIQLHYPPIIRHESRIADNSFYSLLERTWMLQQLPWVLAFYHLGSWSWVFWGIYVRIAVSATGLWLAEYLTHHRLNRQYKKQPSRKYRSGFSQQRRSLQKRSALLGIVTLGECWQSNHKAFPTAARFSLYPGQTDPSWWIINALSRLGLIWSIQYSSNSVTLGDRHSVLLKTSRLATEEAASVGQPSPQSGARLSSLNS